MAKTRKKKKCNAGTFWFLAIIAFSLIGVATTTNRSMIWSIVGICGAIVAYKNIQKKEEVSFLIAASSLLIVIMMTLVVPDFQGAVFPLLREFMINLGVGFSVASFVVALGLISRVCLD